MWQTVGVADEAAGSARSWHWYVEEDPGLRCPADKTITLGANGLSYVGDCHHPNWGGGYTIGFQTIAEFLEQGPLDEQLPAALVAEIRAWLLAHVRPTATLELAVVVGDPGRTLERVDARLDGDPITAHRALERGDADVFFSGAIGPGDHVLRAAFVTGGAAPNIAYTRDEAFTVAVGERVRLVFTIAGRDAVVSRVEGGVTGR